MARTWSAPQRGSFVAFGASELCQNGFAWPVGGRGFTRRGLYLMSAALVTAAGAIVPHLDSDVLSTLLFVAGAGLAALVVLLPSETKRENDDNHSGHPRRADLTKVSAIRASAREHFPELLRADASNTALDRAAWAKLTAHMSHELRTPLNAVLGFSELMTNEVFGPLGSGYSAYAHHIHASGRILLKSAEDALAVTALLTAPECKGARPTSRLKSVIDEACAFAAPDLAALSIAVVIDIDPNVDIIGDHQVTRQILINFIADAARNAAAGAVLRVETNSSPEAVEVSLSLTDGRKSSATSESYEMVLAGTLCDLSGAELASCATADGDRNWTLRLARAAQDDLFLAA